MLKWMCAVLVQLEDVKPVEIKEKEAAVLEERKLI